MLPFELPKQRSPPCPKSRRGSVRYPRVSRKTPDKLLARIAALKPTTTAAVDNEAWALKIFHLRASTISIHEPKRKELIALLESAAERAEAANAERTEEVKMATPAAGAPVWPVRRPRSSRSPRAQSSAERCPRGLTIVRMCFRVRFSAFNWCIIL